jgi:pimeloyl-ACP methyl ester carboxylesterase
MYVLIHSPLVGPLTWERVAQQLWQRNIDAVLPVLADSPVSQEPFWKQHVQSVSQAYAQMQINEPVILVGHSGAGPLLPAIGQALTMPVRAYVFVDASVPQNNASRLDLMKTEDPEWAEPFQQELVRGGRYPNWDFSDLSELIPDEALRRQMIAEIRPRGLPFFTEPIPVSNGWPDAPCVYIQFSPSYQKVAARAKADGWPIYNLEAGHFHMLVDAKAVTDLILEAVRKLN